MLTNLNLKLTDNKGNLIDNKGNPILHKNEKLSVNTYFKVRLYEDVPIVSKKKRIASDDFEIPEYHDYMHLCKNNYNVSQLKLICKYYKLKKSGNKHELIYRIYNFLKFSCHAVKIQKNFRGYLLRKLCKMKGPGVIDRKLCINSEDFATLDDIKDIKFSQFYSYVENSCDKEHVYGFDICSLYNYLMKNKNNSKNPYTRSKFPSSIILDLRKIIKYTKFLNIPMSVKFDEQPPQQNELNSIDSINARIVELFQQIDEMGYYTNSEWLINLSHSHYKGFLKDLHDIWNHRLNIDESMKRRIIPPNGCPFNLCRVNVFQMHQESLIQTKRNCVKIIEKFVTSGINNSDRYLGSSHVLTALTLHSQEAAEALPWFFQSVI